MSLVFEALRRDERSVPGPGTRSGSVLSAPARRGRWLLAAVLVLLAGASLWIWRGHEIADRAPTSTRPQPVEPVAAEAPLLPPAVEPPETAAPREAQGQTTLSTFSLAAEQPAQGMEIRIIRPVERPRPQAAPATTAEAPRAGGAPDAQQSTSPLASAASIPQPREEAPGARQDEVPPVATATERTDSVPEQAKEQTPRIDGARLLALFNAAMARADRQQAAELLAQAQAQLGAEHLLVARMEGYYCMRSDCESRARQAYERVLYRLPDDREAGYNLALLDLQSGQLEAASTRLRRLRQVYPGDAALRELQQVIRSRR